MAKDLNKAMIIGNLTRDPEVRTTPNGQTVASFGVATNRQWKGADGNKQEQVEFHNVVVWGKLAEICQQYLAKGRRAYFEGRLQTQQWEGQDGAKRSRTEIVADDMILLDSKGGGGAPGINQTAAAPSEAETSQAAQETGQKKGGDKSPPAGKADDTALDDIPF